MPDLDYLVEIGPQLKIKLGKLYGGKTNYNCLFVRYFPPILAESIKEAILQSKTFLRAAKHFQFQYRYG